MSVYNEFNDSRFKNFLAAHKPRVWKQETPLDLTAYSKPEPSSKTRLRVKETCADRIMDSLAQHQL